MSAQEISGLVPLVLIGEDFQDTIVNIFLSISFNMCFGCSKETSHRDGSFEHPQHRFWMRNKNFFFSNMLSFEACVPYENIHSYDMHEQLSWG